ncbi:MAG: tetratricopeptide repeat protein [Flavobacteriales bacterium]|nr:tetratricopeptide repeat protein [Flavobacteriales bacterium]
MNDYAWDGYLFTQPDSAFYYAQLQYNFAKTKGLKKQMAAALNTQGTSFTIKGDYAKAIDYYTRSLKIYEEIGDKLGIANSLGNIGMIYYNQGDYAKAIDYHTRSLKIQEEIGNKQGIATSLNNIGMIYHNQGDYAKAIDYHTRSLKIKEEMGNKQGIANSLNNIGMIYYDQGDYAKALDYSTRSLKIQEEIGNKQGIAMSLNGIGNIYSDQGDYAKAIDYSTRALALARELGAVIVIKSAAQHLWEVNKKLGRHKAALEMHELYVQMRDSIESEESAKEVIRQEFKYNYEKKAATDSVANAKANEIRNAQIAKQKAEIKAKRNQQYALYGGLVLVLLFAGFVYNRLKITQKQKVIIEQKERETHAQKEIIEEKHKEITDSINYAERIQRSFLATKDMLDNNLKDYFVFFRPKDVVSGDFYWAAELNNGNFAFTCADSTGHGVPGAIMSILNISSLEKSVEKDTEPHQILNTTRRIIIDRLKKDGSPEGGKDGMDCSLLVLNKEKSELTFASANNPVFIVRAAHPNPPEGRESQHSIHPNNEGFEGSSSSPSGRLGGAELLEYKPDKMPVGKHEKEHEPFTLHSLQLQKGDVIYTLTDGFADQFGGDKGKKYMIKNFKELLLNIAHLPMHEQEQKLADEFAAWKGNNEQVDDVCVIGVKI